LENDLTEIIKYVKKQLKEKGPKEKDDDEDMY